VDIIFYNEPSNKRDISQNRAIIQELYVQQDYTGSGYLEECLTGTFSIDNAQTCNKCPSGMYSPSNSSSYCMPCVNGTFASTPGSSVCHNCSYPFKNGSVDSSLCATKSCIFHSGINATNTSSELIYYFNKSRLENFHLDTADYHYYISLCKKVDNPLCIYPSGQPLPAHICAVSKATNISQNFGSDIDVRYTTTGVTFQFKYGDMCANGLQKKTSIVFSCNINSIGSLRLINSSQCELNFLYRGQLGCRLCNEKDFYTVQSACTKGQSTTSVKLISPDCIDWEEKGKITVVYCYSIEFPYFLVISAGLVVIVLIVFLIIGIVRHNRLYSEYSQLRNVHVNNDIDKSDNNDNDNVSLDPEDNKL